MSERGFVARPPEHEPRHRCQRDRNGRDLVHHSPRASRRTSVSPPVVLDVMKHKNGEDKRDHRMEQHSAFMCEKGNHESDDKDDVGEHTFKALTHPRYTLTSRPSSMGRPTET